MEKFIGQPKMLKKVNSAEIERFITEMGPISKPALAKLTGLSLPTVNKVVASLEAEMKVKAVGLMGQGAGRKATVYVANQQAGHYLIIYYQDGDFICSITDMAGEESCDYNMVHTPKKNSALRTLFSIIEEMAELCENEVKAIGIGVPGVVRRDDVITAIPAIPELDGINLKKTIEDKYEIPTFVENDIKLTAVGYYHNHFKKKYSEIIYIYLGSGLGSGIIMNSKLYKGHTGFAGELGFMRMDVPKGDLEPVEKATMEDRILALETLSNSDPADQLIVEIELEITRLITASLTNIISVLNPQVIVLGGDKITQNICKNVYDELYDYISSENVPKIEYDPDCLSGIDGTVNMCISNVSAGLKIVREKGV